MLNQSIIALAFIAILASPVNSAEADDLVSPQEIVAKVKEAAAYLEKEGEAGLKTFDSSNSLFVWKSTYVFVWDCGADAVVAHPVEGVGLKLSTLEDAAGKLMGPEMCTAAKRPDGGWVEYMWPKPLKVGDADRLAYAEAPSRKVTFMLSVKGQPYQVGAGDYNDSLTVQQLDALLTE